MKHLFLAIALFYSLHVFAGEFSGSGGKSIVITPELLILAGKFSDSGQSASLIHRVATTNSSDDKPYIQQTDYGEILRYPTTSDSLEAWEIIEDFDDPNLSGSVFLNYSRLPFGSIEYKGAPTYVCYHYFGDDVYLGVSENQSRLAQAIYFLAYKRGQLPEAKYGECMKTDEFLAQFTNAKNAADIIRELKLITRSERI